MAFNCSQNVQCVDIWNRHANKSKSINKNKHTHAFNFQINFYFGTNISYNFFFFFIKKREVFLTLYGFHDDWLSVYILNTNWALSLNLDEFDCRCIDSVIVYDRNRLCYDHYYYNDLSRENNFIYNLCVCVCVGSHQQWN